jgi:hypothetical protein
MKSFSPKSLGKIFKKLFWFLNVDLIVALDIAGVTSILQQIE